MIDSDYCQSLEKENEKLRKALSEEQTIRDEMEEHCKFFKSGYVVDVKSDSGWDASDESQTVTILMKGREIWKHPAICDKVEKYLLSKAKFREAIQEKEQLQEKISFVLLWVGIIVAISIAVPSIWWVIKWAFLFTP